MRGRALAQLGEQRQRVVGVAKDQQDLGQTLLGAQHSGIVTQIPEGIAGALVPVLCRAIQPHQQPVLIEREVL